MPPAPTDGNPNAWVLDEIAQYVAAGLGLTLGTNCFVGQLPEPNVNGTPIADGLYLIEQQGPTPDLYIDTETHLISLYASSSSTKTAYELIARAFSLLHRKGNYALTNWYIYFSYANGTIRDEDRGPEGNKLFSLSCSLICRNLNNIS